MLMIKKIFFVITLFVLTYSYAQEGSTSPYSFYGIGELKFEGTVENQSMGGISVYSDSIHLNLRNPAAFGDLGLTVFSVGAAHNTTQYKNANKTETKNNASLDYLALGIPIAKNFGLGFGILPFTSIGYNIQSTNDVNGQLQYQEFTGSGGVNKVFLSLGYKINENLNVGVTGNYDFGKLENQNQRLIENVTYGIRENNSSEISGVDFKLSLNYKTKITGDLILRSTLGFAPQANLSSINTKEVSTFRTSSSALGETEVANLYVQGLKYTDLVLPSSLNLGVGIGKELKWFVGTELQSTRTSDFENRFFNTLQGVEYRDSYMVSFGGYYIPNYNSFTSYLSRVVYRAGFKFEETGLLVNNEKINNFGISFGLGIPVSGFSNVNLNFEYGKRGTLNAGLVEENYFNAKISLSLNERWFIKRKYD